MEKIIMERKLIEKDIPIWEWKGIPLIRVGKGTFVTAKPIGKGIRTLEAAKRIAEEFAKKYTCQATVTYDTEWREVIVFLKANFGTKEFIHLNELKTSEVLLLDTMTEGTGHVIAGGYSHGIDEIFHGFISGDDADGEPQPKKLVFLTLRFDPNQLE